MREEVLDTGVDERHVWHGASGSALPKTAKQNAPHFAREKYRPREARTVSRHAH